MVGELDYSNMLVDKAVDNETVPGANIPYVPLPTLTFCLFLAFILLGSVVLVNLLVCKISIPYVTILQATSCLTYIKKRSLVVRRAEQSIVSH